MALMVASEQSASCRAEETSTHCLRSMVVTYRNHKDAVWLPLVVQKLPRLQQEVVDSEGSGGFEDLPGLPRIGWLVVSMNSPFQLVALEEYSQLVYHIARRTPRPGLPHSHNLGISFVNSLPGPFWRHDLSF